MKAAQAEEMQTVEKSPWYFCDPEKNVECRKTMCFMNESCNFNKPCLMTENPEYAMTDVNGEKVIWMIREKIGNERKNILTDLSRRFYPFTRKTGFYVREYFGKIDANETDIKGPEQPEEKERGN